MVTMDAEKNEAERECFYLPSNLLEDSDSIHVEEDDFADLTGVKPLTLDDITFNNTYVIQEESR